MNNKEFEPKVKVIFRKFQNEIVALFPELPYNQYPYLCSCYAQCGQHGSANIHSVIENSKLATEAEYNPLKEELESIGYNLDIKKRYSYKMYQNRVAEINSWIGE